jgi:hypothetical protein
MAELCAAAGVAVPFTGLSKGELFRRFQTAAFKEWGELCRLPGRG